MSTAAAADAPRKGNKKLLVIVAVALLLLALVGGGAVVMLKKSHAAEQDAEDGEGAAPARTASKHDPKAVPTFVPLDPFTVNLADRDAERYAQVGITLEVGDPHVGDQIKAYMPAIRNNILMALAEKTAAQLMDREGKARLADQVRRETVRAMGYEVEDPDSDADEAKKKKRSRKATGELPVTAVHFSNFIIQ